MAKHAIVAYLLVFFMALSFQKSASAAMSGEDMFTQCGIGAMIFPDKPVLATISNVTWDSGTTAVSSGLSESGCSGSKVQAASLIYKKYAAIEAETASGSGLHLTALMEIFGCDSTASEVVLAETREGFAKLVSTSSYADLDDLQKAKSYFHLIDGNVSHSCII